jgi:hypothetical protein
LHNPGEGNFSDGRKTASAKGFGGKVRQGFFAKLFFVLLGKRFCQGLPEGMGCGILTSEEGLHLTGHPPSPTTE